MNFEQIYRESVDRQMQMRRKQMEEPLNRLEKLSPRDSPDTAYALLSRLNQCQETLCRELRYALREMHSAYEASGLSPRCIPLAGLSDVELTATENLLRIVMDALLPYPTKGSVFYLHGRLDSVLEWYVENGQVPRPFFQERCAVVFLHHYNTEKNRNRKLRDYDNMERRCILNVLTRHIFVDDAPRNIVSMDVMTEDQRDFTEICVMPVHHFTDYLLTLKSLL